ncbi:MAG: hypothetical protein R3E12_14870 [Candidatus Eisenbacteria bacterium]
MSHPLWSAKSAVPGQLPGWLSRSRLEQRWPALLESRLLLVTAGAGFGKTSYLASQVSRESRPCIWYTCDALDADEAAFIDSFGRTVASAMAWPDADPMAGEGRMELAPVVQMLHTASAPALVVLDDLHAIPSSSPTCRLLDQLVRWVPSGTVVVLSGREPPGIELARLSVRGAVTRLDASDLAFTEEEVAALLQVRIPGVELPADLVHRICSETEGWPAGLEILLQAMDDPTPDALCEALARLETDPQGWFGFFAEEVVGRLDPSVQEFLRHSSLLPRLEPSTCDEILDRSDSRTMLEGLVRRNLFTLPDGDGAFRYHHLFRSSLQRSCEDHASPSTIRRIRRTAARVFLKYGRPADALLELCAARDLDGVLELLRRHSVDLARSRHTRALRRALEALPARQIRRSPGALLLLGASFDFDGEWVQAERCYRHALALDRTGGEVTGPSPGRNGSRERRRRSRELLVRLGRCPTSRAERVGDLRPSTSSRTVPCLNPGPGSDCFRFSERLPRRKDPGGETHLRCSPAPRRGPGLEFG